MKVFVSYRRNDSRLMTERICDRLADLHGREAIFKDVDSIQISRDFRDSLTKAIRECDVFLAVIGIQWMEPAKNGLRQIDDPGDFVRLEIEQAIKENIPIVPVLIDDASMPRENDLPLTLRPLAYLQASRMRVDPDFRTDFNRLATLLTEHVIDTLIDMMIEEPNQSPQLAYDDNPMVKDVNNAIKTDPYNIKALLWRASLARGYSMTPGGSADGFRYAIADYRKVRELDSNLADAYFGLSDLYYIAAVFDLAKRRRYRVIKTGRVGSDPETGMNDIVFPVIEPLPDKHSRVVFSASLSQLEQGIQLKQTTTEGKVKWNFGPDIGRLMTNIRSVLGLEPLSQSDDMLSGFLASMVIKYDYEATSNIFSQQQPKDKKPTKRIKGDRRK